MSGDIAQYFENLKWERDDAERRSQQTLAHWSDEVKKLKKENEELKTQLVASRTALSIVKDENEVNKKNMFLVMDENKELKEKNMFLKADNKNLNDYLVALMVHCEEGDEDQEEAFHRLTDHSFSWEWKTTDEESNL